MTVDPIATGGSPSCGLTTEQGCQASTCGLFVAPAISMRDSTDQFSGRRHQISRQQQPTKSLGCLTARRIDEHCRHVGQLGKGGRLTNARTNPTMQAQRQPPQPE